MRDTCAWCGADAGRPLKGANWLCHTCNRWQDFAHCPVCFGQVSRARIEKAEQEFPGVLKAAK